MNSAPSSSKSETARRKVRDGQGNQRNLHDHKIKALCFPPESSLGKFRLEEQWTDIDLEASE